MKMFNGRKGFTLTEVIVASIIVVITTGGTFGAYMVSIYFANKFSHRAMAMAEAARVADRLRYRQQQDSLTVSADPYNEDVSGWGMQSEVNDLDAKYYIADVYFELDGQDIREVTTLSDPPKPRTDVFKRIEVKVMWNERSGEA